VDVAWCDFGAEDALAALGVHPETGLSESDVTARLRTHGLNRLREPAPRPAWLLFLDQFRNLLVALLVVGAVVAGAVGDLKDAIVIAVVLVFNAALGYVQERRAARSLAALRGMLALATRVRRDGVAREVVADELVPGDVVLVEAGDRVPADGRLVETWSLEVDESSLTGESLPVAKDAHVTVGPLTGLGERVNCVFMNTQVTQGRGVFVVTATGMGSEIGRVAAAIEGHEEQATPLQRKLAVLGKRLAAISGVAVAAYFVLAVVQGEAVSQALISSVALIVAAIPEGLPAVVTLTLAVGTRRLAQRGAIVKRLASVETLGSTSVICSDKTGTLTLNQMTARHIFVDDTTFDVSGEGYGTLGEIVVEPTTRPGSALIDRELLDRLARVGALCNDSTIHDGALVGDPTEGALVVLASKAGLDVANERRLAPRVGELPFDSARKYMATFHTAADTPGVLVAVKGAWEALAPRCSTIAEDIGPVLLDAPRREHLDRYVASLADRGLRVLAIAAATVTREDMLDGAERREADLEAMTDELTLLGFVGIVDPPRPEAAPAIRRCREAGITVKMVTGDHPGTARAIALQLGIESDVLSGRDLADLDDDELAERLQHIDVVARVSPLDKVRIVRALQARGAVVAMTGDGVNDAAALSWSDIGVAMGSSGTEVAKDAADMVLTDDNFATITRAVEQGRTVYDNIVKFVRFQLATNVAALTALIGAQIFGLPAPFSPIQVLWINMIMDGPPAMALGVDPTAPDAMSRPPRPTDEHILGGGRLARVVTSGLVMAIGTLVAYGVALDATSEAHALTFAFTTFVCFQLVNALISRSETTSVFARATLRNGNLWAALAGVLALQALAVHFGPIQSVFGTATLSARDWLLAAAVASSLLWFDELRKLAARRIGIKQ
jgi:Ca2+-transporting ATPase